MALVQLLKNFLQGKNGLEPIGDVMGSGRCGLLQLSLECVDMRSLVFSLVGRIWVPSERGDAVSTSELEVRHQHRGEEERLQDEEEIYVGFALELPGICMLVSNYFMASTAEGPDPVGSYWGFPKGPCRAEG